MPVVFLISLPCCSHRWDNLSVSSCPLEQACVDCRPYAACLLFFFFPFTLQWTDVRTKGLTERGQFSCFPPLFSYLNFKHELWTTFKPEKVNWWQTEIQKKKKLEQQQLTSERFRFKNRKPKFWSPSAQTLTAPGSTKNVLVSSKSKWLVVNSQKLAAAADDDDADAEAARLVPLQSPPLESKGHSILLILDVLHAFYDKTTFFFSFFLSFFLSFFSTECLSIKGAGGSGRSP